MFGYKRMVVRKTPDAARFQPLDGETAVIGQINRYSGASMARLAGADWSYPV